MKYHIKIEFEIDTHNFHKCGHSSVDAGRLAEAMLRGEADFPEEARVVVNGANKLRGEGFQELRELQSAIHRTAIEKGWWQENEVIQALKLNGQRLKDAGILTQTQIAQLDELGERNFGEMVCLMHSELSEALEADREHKERSRVVPEFSCVEEEFADVIIRILDLAERHGWDVIGAVVAKAAYNTKRKYKHGGKKY